MTEGNLVFIMARRLRGTRNSSVNARSLEAAVKHNAGEYYTFNELDVVHKRWE